MSRTTRTLLAAVAVTGLLAGACSDDDATDTSADDTTTTVPAPATDAAAVGGDQVIEVVGVDSAFEGVPSSVPAGPRR
jgi:hypothetical protein